MIATGKLNSSQKQDKLIITSPVIILANGVFPKHTCPLNIIRQAGTLVCTDGSADVAIENGFKPEIIIGDLDSISNASSSYNCPIIPINTQENTDLEKSIDWLIENSINEIWLTGITGGRDDQSLAILIILNHYSNQIQLSAVTDLFTIDFFSGSRKFKSFPGQTISLMAFKPVDKITTSGLEFPLIREKLIPSGKGISNRALGTEFSISASNNLIVFRSHNKI
ncbi:MAG: thiamine diphosphokinase [Candidatus Marinimicrobia bacterium]|nr:thiamine diphosphokinase [Candidatus Neomarinimicrobiota bacterium]